jgi:MFS family permease
MVLPSVFRDLPRTFWVLWIGIIIDRIGGFAFAFLTLYLTTERHLSVDEATAIVSLAGLGGLGGALAGGILADHLGRKATIVIGMALSGVVMAALGFVRSPLPIGVLWLLYGFTGGAVRPASSALVADIVPAADRMRAFSLLHWGVNIGFAVAPVLGGILARRTYTALFLVDGATTLATVGLIAAFVPSTAPPPPTEPPWRGLTRVFRDARYLGYLAVAFAIMAVFQQAQSLLPVVMVQQGLSTETFGVVLAVNGVLIAFVSPIVAGRLGRHHPTLVYAWAAGFVGVGFGMNALAATGPAYAAAVVVWTLGEILSTPAGGAIVAELAPASQRGRYNGAASMAASLAQFAGPPAGGLILSRLGPTWLWLGCLGVGLACAAAMLGMTRSWGRRRVTPGEGGG